MKTSIIIFLLLASSAFAQTNYVYVTGSTPTITGSNYAYNVGSDSVQVGEFSMIGIDWSQVRVVSTTSKIPAVFTNINQIVILETVLPLSKEQREDWTRRASPETIAIVEGVVAAINAKLGKAQEITATELKTAIGAKLQAAEASKETAK